MKKVRLGLVGCGEMMEYRCRNICNAENVEITAVCDIDAEKANKIAANFENVYITTDYYDMVDYVDAVYIALPNDEHYLCGKYFAQKKKHVLMEAPMCNWVEEAETLVETCKAEGVTLMGAFPARFRPGVRKLKELLASGEYGQNIMMTMRAEEYASYDELHWAATGRIGGSQFFSEAGQYLDVMMWYLGSPVNGCYIGTDIGTSSWMLEQGTGTATLEFESTAIGYICTTWGAKGSYLGRNIQIHTEKGMFDYDFDTGEIRLYDQLTAHGPGLDENRGHHTVMQEDMEEVKNTPYEINHFADCILNSKDPETSGDNVLQVQKAIWKLTDAEQHNLVADLRGIALN